MLSALIIGAGLAMVCACGGEGSGGSTPTAGTVTVSEESLSCSSAETTLYVTVNASDSWESYTNDEWISVDPSYSKASSGKVTVKVSENPSTSSRTGSVVVKCGSTRKSIPLTQGGVITSEDIEAPEGYSLVWHDEFESGDRPSASLWSYETGTGSNGWGNNELQYYVSPETPEGENCASVKDGILTIKCLKENGTVYSIRMNTRDSWTYGYFEARMKLPTGKGTWPAFWMMPKNFSTWPGDGEIDIMEEVGYDPNVIHSTIHCNKYNNTGTSIESGRKTVSTSQTDFHVYALEWTSEYMKFLVDGSAILTYKNDGTGYDAWPFYTPFYLKLNLAWGGDWGGAQGVDESCLPATFQIDYVRVFQKD